MVAINILDFLDFYRSLFPFPHKITFLGDQNANNQEENIFIGPGFVSFISAFARPTFLFLFFTAGGPQKLNR